MIWVNKMIEKRIKLEEYKIFQNLSREFRNDLTTSSYYIIANKNENLFLENNQVDNIYFLLEGNVTLYKENFNGKKKIIYMIGPGNFINEAAIEGLPSSVSCDIFQDSKLLMIAVSAMKNLFRKHPDFSLVFMESMSKKMRRLYRQIKNSSAISMEKKIAAKLWKLSRDYGTQDGEWMRLSIKVSNILLAEMLGTNRETISRGMQKLVEKELIQKKDGRFYIRSEAMKGFYRS